MKVAYRPKQALPLRSKVALRRCATIVLYGHGLRRCAAPPAISKARGTRKWPRGSIDSDRRGMAARGPAGGVCPNRLPNPSQTAPATVHQRRAEESSSLAHRSYEPCSLGVPLQSARPRCAAQLQPRHPSRPRQAMAPPASLVVWAERKAGSRESAAVRRRRRLRGSIDSDRRGMAARAPAGGVCPNRLPNSTQTPFGPRPKHVETMH